MSIGLLISIALALMAAALAVAATTWWVQRPLSGRRTAERSVPTMVASTNARGGSTRTAGPRATTSRTTADTGSLPLFSHRQAAVWNHDERDEQAELAAAHGLRHDADAEMVDTARDAGGTATRTAPASWRYAAASVPTRRIVGSTVRFSVPVDSTATFLPGRFVIRGGPDSGQQLRFVEVPGDRDVAITIGSDDGPPLRHVQLRSPSVAPQHAELAWREGRWWVRQLTAQAPTLVDAHMLGRDDVRPLEVGARLQIGDVVLRVDA
ncbi:MAG: FHA domain-containing protein [Gemmatimonadetes bacterium]|nr:FHA domain-containing protein [Gemmatimonadota bacterium]